MTALHAQSCCCYDCTPGFPAEPPVVHYERIAADSLSRPQWLRRAHVRMAEKLKAQQDERQRLKMREWRKRNRGRMNEYQRAYRERQKLALQGVVL